MSHLDIFINMEDVIRINLRTNREKDWMRNLFMLPLKSRKIDRKLRYTLDYDVANRSLGEERPEAIPFPGINLTVPKIVNDSWWIAYALSEIKGLSDLDMFNQAQKIPKEANTFTYDKWWSVSRDGFYLKTRLRFLKINSDLFDKLKTRVLDDETAREVAEEFMIHDWGNDEIPTAEERAIGRNVGHYESYCEELGRLFGRKKGYRTARWY